MNPQSILSTGHTHPLMRSTIEFENAAARKALAESRAEESRRTARLYDLSGRIQFHAQRGMSRRSLERIYGRDVVTDVFAAMRRETDAVTATGG